MTIKLTRSQKVQVLSSADVYPIMQQILKKESKIDRNKEHFWLISLSNINKILLIELISVGSVHATIVEPMDVFSFALQKRAVKIILVHNHPSGDLLPTKPDIEVTDKMMAIGKFVQVPVVDHLIISETDYFSFLDMGLLKQIEKETTYDLTFKEIDKLKARIEELENNTDSKVVEAKKAIAKAMLENGVSIEVVIKSSGLTKAQVQKLKAEKPVSAKPAKKTVAKPVSKPRKKK